VDVSKPFVMPVDCVALEVKECIGEKYFSTLLSTNLRELCMPNFSIPAFLLQPMKFLEILEVYSIQHKSHEDCKFPSSLTMLTFCNFSHANVPFHDGIVHLRYMTISAVKATCLPLKLTTLYLKSLDTWSQELFCILHTFSFTGDLNTWNEIVLLPSTLQHLYLTTCCCTDTIFTHFSALQTLHLSSITDLQLLNMFQVFPLFQSFQAKNVFTHQPSVLWNQKGTWYQNVEMYMLGMNRTCIWHPFKFMRPKHIEWLQWEFDLGQNSWVLVN
jgi:hypothetical protein